MYQPSSSSKIDSGKQMRTRPNRLTLRSSPSGGLFRISRLHMFLGRCDNVTEAVHRKVDDIESLVLRRLCCANQKKIEDFFINCAVCAVFNRVSGASITINVGSFFL
ncbi:hypothetical protein ISCGN_019704 [Ixodes scapularis]